MYRIRVDTELEQGSLSSYRFVFHDGRRVRDSYDSQKADDTIARHVSFTSNGGGKWYTEPADFVTVSRVHIYIYL